MNRDQLIQKLEARIAAGIRLDVPTASVGTIRDYVQHKADCWRVIGEWHDRPSTDDMGRVSYVRELGGPPSEKCTCGLDALLAGERGTAPQETDKFKAALMQIRDTEGKVCENFELCEHVACASSYGAWAIADAALNAVGERGTPAEPPPQELRDAFRAGYAAHPGDLGGWAFDVEGSAAGDLEPHAWDAWRREVEGSGGVPNTPNKAWADAASADLAAAQNPQQLATGAAGDAASDSKTEQP